MNNAMEKLLANKYKLYLGSNLLKGSFKLLRYHHKWKIKRYCAWLYNNIPFKNNSKSLEFILLSYPSFSEGEYQIVITPTRYIFIVIIIERR